MNHPPSPSGQRPPIDLYLRVRQQGIASQVVSTIVLVGAVCLALGSCAACGFSPWVGLPIFVFSLLCFAAHQNATQLKHPCPLCGQATTIRRALIVQRCTKCTQDFTVSYSP